MAYAQNETAKRQCAGDLPAPPTGPENFSRQSAARKDWLLRIGLSRLAPRDQGRTDSDPTK